MVCIGEKLSLHPSLQAQSKFSALALSTAVPGGLSGIPPISMRSKNIYDVLASIAM